MRTKTATSRRRASPWTEKARFVLVGCINTAIDFIVFNVLLAFLGQSIYLANILSTLTAMIASVFLNKGFVFKQGFKVSARETTLFMAVTLTSLWGVQNLVIFLLTHQFPEPLNTIAHTIHGYGTTEFFSVSFLRDNGAKVAATVVSLMWNFVFYKYVVFKKSQVKQHSR